MATFPKTLIIGLGGLGSDVVVEVFKRFKGHSVHKDDYKKVRFIALDTDSNEISERREIMKPEDVIQTSASTSVTVGHFLDEIKDISTVRNWFPVDSSEIAQMSINDGAGQIRVVSRLALSHAIHNNKLDRVEKAIGELLSLSAGDGNVIEVHVVTSLAGGTGAGAFLQMGYFVREILRRNNITNPKVWGYFLLGDVFLRDASINLSDPTKTTNILANTYACIKELNGIYEVKGDGQIEFEYGRFSKQPFYITKENSIPFDQCFLYDYENNEGNNIKSISNYANQMIEYIYLNAFSPAGAETRSRAINDIFRQMEQGVGSRYGSTGISKIVYPIDNLLRYFSVRRLSENLQSTWLKIDNTFDKLHEEWRIDMNKGIIKKEPLRSEFFMNNVETLAQNALGKEQAIFKSIWQSTQLVDKNSLQVQGSKSTQLLKSIVAYLTGLRDNNPEISSFSKVRHNESFLGKTNDEANDRTNIRQVEDGLETLQRAVFDFIDDNKNLAIEEIFTKDVGSPGYYYEEAKHRINTYLLEKDEALHPLAQRYFFYDLLHRLEQELNKLKESNSKKLARISAYKETYDVKTGEGPDDYIESALDAYEIYRSGNSSILSTLSRLTGKSSQLADFKNDYVTKSKLQARNLNDFALERLEEYVFEGLIIQIKKMIENLETLFKGIPSVLIGLRNETSALVSLTDENTSNPSVINILSSQSHRDYIYQEVIGKNDTIFFPEDISRNIYEELYQRTCSQINNPLQHTYDRVEDRINRIFTDLVVTKQKEQLGEAFADDFAGYNIIEAMRKQAGLDNAPAIEFMEARCREAETRATPFGAKYEASDPKINSWALHPECLEYQYLNPDDADRLFNTPGNRQNNANRVISDYFDRTEIIREDAVMVLSVPKNYPKFAPKDASRDYSTSLEGIYYTYYKKRISEIEKDPNLPTPHLDARWNNPRYFRDLGVNLDAYEKNILKAYVFGLANKDIMLVDNFGSLTWGYNIDRGIDYMVDNEGKNIRSNVRKLIIESLWNNERVVRFINEKFESEIGKAKQAWEQARMEGKSLNTISLLRNIFRFKFDKIEVHKGQNILSIFTGNLTDPSTDSRFVSLLLEVLLELIVEVVGNTGQNTKEQAEALIGKLIDAVPTSGIPLERDLIRRTFKIELDKIFTD